MKKLLYLIGFILIIKCQSADNRSEENKSNESLKPVTDLEYSEIVDKVMFDVGEHIEYHGEPINEEAKADRSYCKRKYLSDSFCYSSFS